MGLQVTLNIHQVDGDTKFDVGKANAALMDDYNGFGQLYDEISEEDDDFEGPFTVVDGNLKIACRSEDDFEGYKNYTEVWGCYNDQVFQTIADNIIQGKIVFHIEIEGNPDQYYICTPGKIEQRSASKVTF